MGVNKGSLQIIDIEVILENWPIVLLYGSIFTSILLVKVVWDKISGHT